MVFTWNGNYTSRNPINLGPKNPIDCFLRGLKPLLSTKKRHSKIFCIFKKPKKKSNDISVAKAT